MNDRVRRSFGAAAAGYDRHAGLQRLVAATLARRIAAGIAPGSAPARVLEIGCGTGLLAERLAGSLGWPIETRWTLTDLSPEMLAAAHARLSGRPGRWTFRGLDLDDPAAIDGLDGDFDLICGSLVWQWLADPSATAAALARRLAPGGRLALSTLAEGSLEEWRAAWPGEPPLPTWPSGAALQAHWPGPGGHWSIQAVSVGHDGARAFLRDLRGIGAALGSRPAAPGRLRAAMRRLDAETGGDVSYRIGYGVWRRPPRAGVFVTGTDTGIGKTLVAAIVARALDAVYYKPLQTGLAEEAGDGPTVARLAGVEILPPFAALRAPLSPQDAARAEGVRLDLDRLVLPSGAGPIVVEGAGGVLVPADERVLLIDLIARFGLPVLLVARSTLGTINHTLLSLEALRARRIPIAGVIFSGPPDAGNRRAIETHGRVRVLAEIPVLEVVDPQAVMWLAETLRPELRDVLRSAQ